MRLFFLSLLTFLCSSLAPALQSQISGSPGAPAYAADPKFQAALAEATLFIRHKQFSFAVDDFRKANKLAGGQCLACLVSIYDAQMSGGSFKDAATTASSLEAMANGPAGKAAAEIRRARALYGAAGEKPKPEKLEAIHATLQEALLLEPRSASALFLDGKVLAGLGKFEDSRAVFSRCVQCVDPRDPARIRAAHFAENPELALHKMAPIFEVTALDGSHFNLDAMGGRVVLIDFWATWCGPCNRELPHMKKIAKEFEGQPLVILSVSWDHDEAAWKNFIDKNGMTWVQYRDADHRLGDLFGINAIPHYFTIDSDGVLTAEMLGEGANIEGKLKKLLAKAREARQETAAEATPSPAAE